MRHLKSKERSFALIRNGELNGSPTRSGESGYGAGVLAASTNGVGYQPGKIINSEAPR